MINWIQKWKQAHKETERPDWDSFWMTIAILVSIRSHDAETKHGCVLIDNKNHIKSIGYNGMPSGFDDSTLPNTRPLKYKWVLHSERNALHNCESRPDGCTAYITGKPCVECLKALYQEGVKKLVLLKRVGSVSLSTDEEETAVWDEMVKRGAIEIRWMDNINLTPFIEHFNSIIDSAN